jgi:hypothetical protein
MPIVYPVIIVPAITATYLTDEYPLPPESLDVRGNLWGRQVPGVQTWQPPLELWEKE